MTAVRDNVTGTVSADSERILKRISADTDASTYSEDDLGVLRELCLGGFAYVVANEGKETIHAHLKDRGREAIGLGPR